MRREARTAIEIVLGTMPWLVLAGLIEGFVSPRQLPLGAALAVGVIAAGAYWALLSAGAVIARPLDLARR